MNNFGTRPHPSNDSFRNSLIRLAEFSSRIGELEIALRATTELIEPVVNAWEDNAAGKKEFLEQIKINKNLL